MSRVTTAPDAEIADRSRGVQSGANRGANGIVAARRRPWLASANSLKPQRPALPCADRAGLRIESSTTELRWRSPNLAARCSTGYSTASARGHPAEVPVDRRRGPRRVLVVSAPAAPAIYPHLVRMLADPPLACRADRHIGIAWSFAPPQWRTWNRLGPVMGLKKSTNPLDAVTPS